VDPRHFRVGAHDPHLRFRTVTGQRLAEQPIGAAATRTLDEVEWWITNFTTEPA